MRRHVFRTLLVSGAVAATVALGAGQAFAASTITITGAGGPFSATSTNAVLTDVTTGQTFRCASTGFSGSLANVTNAPLPYTAVQAGGAVHAITTWSVGGCTTQTFSPAGLPDDLVFTAVSATAPQASGFLQTAGTSGLLFRVAESLCSFNVAGQADFTWTNGTSNQLRFTGNALHPTNVSAGCLGLVSPTDILAFTGTFNFSPTIMIGPGQ